MSVQVIHVRTEANASMGPISSLVNAFEDGQEFSVKTVKCSYYLPLFQALSQITTTQIPL